MHYELYCQTCGQTIEVDDSVAHINHHLDNKEFRIVFVAVKKHQSRANDSV